HAPVWTGCHPVTSPIAITNINVTKAMSTTATYKNPDLNVTDEEFKQWADRVFDVERPKRFPLPEGVPSPDTYRAHVLGALKKLPISRWYALKDSQEAWTALAAVVAAWQQKRAQEGQTLSREEAAEFLKSLADFDFVSGLMQTWRPGPELPPPD